MVGDPARNRSAHSVSGRFFTGKLGLRGYKARLN